MLSLRNTPAARLLYPAPHLWIPKFDFAKLVCKGTAGSRKLIRAGSPAKLSHGCSCGGVCSDTPAAEYQITFSGYSGVWAPLNNTFIVTTPGCGTGSCWGCGPGCFFSYYSSSLRGYVILLFKNCGSAYSVYVLITISCCNINTCTTFSGTPQFQKDYSNSFACSGLTAVPIPQVNNPGSGGVGSCVVGTYP